MCRIKCFKNYTRSIRLLLVFFFVGAVLSACQSEEPLSSGPEPTPHPSHSQQRALSGFIDKTGKFVIKPQFVTASSFHEGLAHVVDPRGSFIDKSGKFLIKEAYYVAGDFSEGLASVGIPKPNGAWSDVNRPGDQLLYGFIDKTGKFVIQPQFKATLDFSEGLAAVMPQHSNAWGFVDRHGKMVLAPRFIIGLDDLDRDLPNFKNGVACVTTEAGPVYINKLGETLDKHTAKKMRARADYDEEGLKSTYDKGFHGYIDEKGRTVIACKFDKVTPFYDGLGLVRMVGGLWGFIDREGKWAIPPNDKYDYEHFSEGLCEVKAHNNEPGNYGFVDKTGKLVIPLSFSTAEYFHEGVAAVSWPVPAEQIEKIKLPFEYTLQGNILSFPIKFTEKDDDPDPQAK